MILRIETLRLSSLFFTSIVILTLLCGCSVDQVDLSPKKVKEKQAEQVLSDKGISITDIFSFSSGERYPAGFVGSSSYKLQFEADISIYDAVENVSRQNHTNPLGSIYKHDCRAAEMRFAQTLGMPCSETKTAAATIENGMNSISLILAESNSGKSTELYVYIEGT